MNRRLIILVLLLVLGTLAGCTRIAGPQGWSGGSVVGDTMYIGTREGDIRALDRTNGQTNWKFAVGGEKSGRASGGGTRAIYGTPAIAEGTLYVGGYDGVLYALSLEGAVKWQELLGGGIVGSPVVAGNLVLVGSSDGTLHAFNTTTQAEVWKFPTGGKIWSTPAVAGGVAYFGSLDHNIYAVSLTDGSKRWQFPTGGAVAASPLVAKGRVYVGSFDSTFYAINAETGEKVWQFEEARNWYWAPAIASGNTVYAPSLDGNLYALDMDSGELRWTLKTDGPIVGAPAVVLDMIAVGSNDGKVRLARLKDGVEVDACNIGQAIWTPLVEQGGSIYFGAEDHSIRALKIKPGGNPDEVWVHLTDKDDPLPRGQTPAC